MTTVDTPAQFDEIAKVCEDLFLAKLNDYGTNWRVMRLPSLTDQIYIKAQRIRSIEDKGAQKIPDSIESEFVGIFNYAIMALIQLKMGVVDKPKSENQAIINAYITERNTTRDLMLNKNHDYGEAWRKMRITSFTDMILQKILRIKQIEENRGEVKVSEGVDGNYRDIINYAAFALISLTEQKK